MNLFPTPLAPLVARRAVSGSSAGAVGAIALTTVRCLTASTSAPTSATATLVSGWCVQPTKVGWL